MSAGSLSSAALGPPPVANDECEATLVTGGADRGRYVAACGIAGPVLLALYFGIPALVPRLGSLLYSGAPSTGRIVAVGAEYHQLLALGGWLQGTGALLCVVFFLALVQWSGGVSTLAGRIVLLGCAVLLAVVLAEMVFTFTWASAANAGQPVSARAAYDLMARFIQVFPIVPAPTVYLALAAVLAGTRSVLPALFALLAAALGIAFIIVGLAGVLVPASSAACGGLAGLQDAWILAAAIAVLRRGEFTSPRLNSDPRSSGGRPNRSSRSDNPPAGGASSSA